jgi:hypothetical protein
MPRGDLARQLQHPHEQRCDVHEKAVPKRVRGDEAERYRIVGRTLQLPALKHGRPAATIALYHRRQVQPVDHLDDKPQEMPLRKPFIELRRYQAHRAREPNVPAYPVRHMIRQVRQAASGHLTSSHNICSLGGTAPYHALGSAGKGFMSLCRYRWHGNSFKCGRPFPCRSPRYAVYVALWS